MELEYPENEQLFGLFRNRPKILSRLSWNIPTHKCDFDAVAYFLVHFFIINIHAFEKLGLSINTATYFVQRIHFELELHLSLVEKDTCILQRHHKMSPDCFDSWLLDNHSLIHRGNKSRLIQITLLTLQCNSFLQWFDLVV